ncbi:hypothetical protein EUGRSUZ_K00545 [Eucalyptus grandis]|uniref:Uncharacterized protein n=2 Tax=Eucalyptus grandis TaxID=71139 RepID=A0ACC3IQT2_EUCGR|nr:hypothetical protein EUGRSUZ_K00545 [Eucalyptus grandis]
MLLFTAPSTDDGDNTFGPVLVEERMKKMPRQKTLFIKHAQFRRTVGPEGREKEKTQYAPLPTLKFSINV